MSETPETKILKLEAKLEIAHAEIAELKTANAEFKTALSKANVARPIALAALSAGVMREALDDAVARAERAGWKTDEDGNPVLWDSKNNSPVYSPTKPGNLTPEEWAKGLETAAPHYFSTPGDNQHQNGGGQQASRVNLSGPNPWLKESWDDMAQVAIIRADRGKAEALAKAAGSRLGALKPA